MDAIHKILVPTDFSAHADEAFRVAHKLAGLTGAEVILFHVARPPAVVTEAGQLLADPSKGETVNLWERFQSMQPSDPKVRVEYQVIVAGRPRAGYILEILDQLGCDLIVMGTHRRSWLKQRLFGSVTEEVARLARCPVMVAKAPSPVVDQPIPEPVQMTGA
ncbi:MAG TPA: universal stress protein [Gemmataceae bacterium]|nr:universal stress protein [Gemmataceae bacterium]